jgi:hypothetical protein
VGLLLCLAPGALCGVAATVAAKRLLPRVGVSPAGVERFAALGGVATAVTWFVFFLDWLSWGLGQLDARYEASTLYMQYRSLLPHGPLY